jgi:hypothetical protein
VRTVEVHFAARPLAELQLPPRLRQKVAIETPTLPLPLSLSVHSVHAHSGQCRSGQGGHPRRDAPSRGRKRWRNPGALGRGWRGLGPPPHGLGSQGARKTVSVSRCPFTIPDAFLSHSRNNLISLLFVSYSLAGIENELRFHFA